MLITVKNTASTATLSERSGQSSSGTYAIEETTDINVNIENVRLEGFGSRSFQVILTASGRSAPVSPSSFTFTIQAPSSSGIFYPEVWIDTTGGKSTRYPVPVNVNTAIGIEKDAILIMESTLTGSQNPGEEIPVTITITNAGRMQAEDVTLRIENLTGMVAPKSSDLYHAGTIAAGDKKNVSLVLLSDRKIGAGLVKIPVTIQYKTMDGREKTGSSAVGIPFKGIAELGFVTVDTNPPRLTEGTPFDLTVRIENTGTGEAKQVSATVDLQVEGKKEAFIGKIKPGNDAPAIFLLEGAPPGTHPYTLTIHYTDDMGRHTMTRPMSQQVSHTDSSGIVIPGIIALGFIILLLYRYWYRPGTGGNRKFPWERRS